MDENKPRRRWLSFGIRDLLWAVVVVGLTLGWWADHQKQKAGFWNLRAAIENAGFSTYHDGSYYIEPMNQWQRYKSEQKRRR